MGFVLIRQVFMVSREAGDAQGDWRKQLNLKLNIASGNIDLQVNKMGFSASDIAKEKVFQLKK